MTPLASERRMLKRRRLVALALGVGVTSVVIATVAAAGWKQFSNPDAGLTDAERHAAISDARDAFHARYEAWLAEFVASGRDPSTLPQSEMMVSYPPPLEDLPTAVDQATLIVIGTSRAISFEPMAGATVTFEVEQALKGPPGDSVRIQQGGGPMPGPDWSLDTGTLGYAPGERLLLPGDRALLFLETAAGGTYHVQSFTGIYRLEDGAVAALDLNPFGAEVDGSTESDFVARIRDLVASD